MNTKISILILSIQFYTTVTFAQGHVYDYRHKDLGTWVIKNGVFFDNNNAYNSIAKFNWKVFYHLFPKKISQTYIKEIVLFTDGLDNKTGGVESIGKSNKFFRLLIDIADVDFRSRTIDRVRQSEYTFIHEFGHLISLNYTQITPSLKSKQNEGDPYITYEGQALVDSYINKFVDLYWGDSMLTEWDLIETKYCTKGENKLCLKQKYTFYGKNYNEFLTDYAAESPEEDIAESWTDFVLRRRRIKQTNLVAHKKVNFFYDFSELIKYRKIIRKNLKKLNKQEYKI